MSNRIHLPKNLFILRKLHGLRQDEMESKTGCSRTTWSNYENGISEPSVTTLVNISHFFGTTLDELVLKDFSMDTHLSFRKKRTKSAIYDEVELEEQVAVEEKDLKYLMAELKKLREEMENMKKNELSKT